MLLLLLLLLLLMMMMMMHTVMMMRKYTDLRVTQAKVVFYSISILNWSLICCRRVAAVTNCSAFLWIRQMVTRRRQEMMQAGVSSEAGNYCQPLVLMN